MDRGSLKTDYSAHPAPRGVPGVIDSIMVRPRSKGELVLPGEYSVENRPQYHVGVEAINRNAVVTRERQIGDRERYVVRVTVSNYNDSPAFAYLQVAQEN